MWWALNDDAYGATNPGAMAAAGSKPAFATATQANEAMSWKELDKDVKSWFNYKFNGILLSAHQKFIGHIFWILRIFFCGKNFCESMLIARRYERLWCISNALIDLL